MRIVLQRCKQAEVRISGEIIGSIQEGVTLLVGITHEDTLKDVRYLADKVSQLRIFEDEDGKMNRSLLEIGGHILSVSQFTLYGECRKGRRPNFMAAAKPDLAKPLYDAFNDELKKLGIRVETGRFGEMMDVELVNWGPVTLILES